MEEKVLMEGITNPVVKTGRLKKLLTFRRTISIIIV